MPNIKQKTFKRRKVRKNSNGSLNRLVKKKVSTLKKKHRKPHQTKNRKTKMKQLRHFRGGGG